MQASRAQAESARSPRQAEHPGDGKEIFYLPLDNKIMAVPVALHAGTPMPLFAVHLALGTVHDF